MHSYEILLSLMIITLYSAQVHSDIMCPKNDEELTNIMETADQNKKLCLMYLVVNSNKYDGTFNEMAKKYSSTEFIKIDIAKFETIDGFQFVVETEPTIHFYKFDCTTTAIPFDHESDWPKLIEYFGKLKKETFCQFSDSYQDGVNSTQILPKQQNQVHSDIMCPKNDEDLTNIMKTADKNKNMCLMYLVVNSYKYDGTFNEMAKKYSSTVFIKIDTMKFETSDGFQFDVETELTIYFYKFDCITTAISVTNKSELPGLIEYFGIMKKDNFCRFSDEYPNGVDSSQILPQQQIQVHSNIHRPKNDDELTEIMITADQNKNMCLMYLVVDSDKYDELFNRIAQIYSSTVFVKIDITKLKTTDGFKFVVETEPTIHFYKFGCTTTAITATHEYQVRDFIEYLDRLKKEEFCQFTEDDEDSSQMQEQQSQEHSGNVVQHPEDADHLLDALRTAADNDQPSVIFIHRDDDDNLDSIIRKLASLFEDALIIDVDDNNFDDTGKLYDKDAQPSLIFGHNTERFTPPDHDQSKSEVSDNEDMSLEDYELAIELAIQRSKDERDTQLASRGEDNQAPTENRIHHPKNTDQLLNILQDADKNGKLCLMYLVINTDEYDQMFIQLANIFKLTVFIKIDTATYTCSSKYRFVVEEQPSIIFRKFRRNTKAFSTTNMEELSNKIIENQNIPDANLTQNTTPYAADYSQTREQQRSDANLKEITINKF